MKNDYQGLGPGARLQKIRDSKTISTKKVLLEGEREWNPGWEGGRLLRPRQQVRSFGPSSSEPIAPYVQRFLLPFWSCTNRKTGCRCIKARHRSHAMQGMLHRGVVKIDDLFARFHARLQLITKTESFVQGVSRRQGRQAKLQLGEMSNVIGEATLAGCGAV